MQRLPDTPRSDFVPSPTSPSKSDHKYTRQGANGPEQYNKYGRQGAYEGGSSAFFCNFLDNHGVDPDKVLRKAAASLMPTGTILLLSKHSTQTVQNTGPAPSPATRTILKLMPRVPLMPLAPLMIVTKLLYLSGSVQGLIISLYVSPGFLHGGPVTDNLSWIQGLVY